MQPQICTQGSGNGKSSIKKCAALKVWDKRVNPALWAQAKRAVEPGIFVALRGDPFSSARRTMFSVRDLLNRGVL